MRNSTILFLAAFVILVWFESEALTANELCATGCISLSPLNLPEEGIVAAILPVLLLIGGLRARRNEKHQTAPPAQPPESK